MLEEAGLGRKYWLYAEEYVVFSKNRLPYPALERTSFEKLTRKPPTFNHVRVFGCAPFIHNTSPASKIPANAVPAIHFEVNDHGVYILETLTDQRVQHSENVTFDESKFPTISKYESSSGDGHSKGGGFEIAYSAGYDDFAKVKWKLTFPIWGEAIISMRV